MRWYLILSLILSALASGKEVLSSYNFLNNGMIPEGVITIGMNGSRSNSIRERFAGNGGLITNQKYNSRSLSFADLASASSNESENVLAQAAFGAYDISLQNSAGRVENSLNIQTEAEVYILGFGLTPKSNLLVIVPTINIKFDIDSRFYPSNSYENLLTSLNADGQRSKAEYLRRIQRNPLQTRLEENGQKMPEEINSIANVYLNYRYAFSEFIADAQLILPYGKVYSTDEFIDFRINDQSLGAKLGLGKDFRVNSHALGFYGSYHYRSPFEMDYRIPRSSNDPFATDIENGVQVKYGDQIDLTGQYNYAWNSLLGTYFNLRYLHSFQDDYDGQLEQYRYNILERETESRSVSAQLGLTLNTISSFLAKKFIAPIDLNLQASKIISGKNTFASDWVGFNLMVFYK